LKLLFGGGSRRGSTLGGGDHHVQGGLVAWISRGDLRGEKRETAGKRRGGGGGKIS